LAQDQTGKSTLYSCGYEETVVTGERETGKSTMLENFVPNIPNLTFDDLRLRFLAKKDLSLFIADNKAPIFIDEMQ
jgi:predicted AAA+ superfamily ATPase